MIRVTIETTREDSRKLIDAMGADFSNKFDISFKSLGVQSFEADACRDCYQFSLTCIGDNIDHIEKA